MGATAESLLTPSVLGLIESLVGQGQIDAAFATRQDQGQRLARRLPDDGFQTDGVRLETLAGVERFNAHSRCDRRRSVRRRRQAQPGKGRRLIMNLVHTQQLTIPPSAAL